MSRGSPAWSPDSATVLVQGFANNPPSPSPDGTAKLWDLRGGELLRRRGPGFSVNGAAGGILGFLDSKHLLARRNPAKGMPAAFETINIQGQVVDTWTVPKHWTVADISPERGLFAILSDHASKTLVVDHPSNKVILTRDNPYGYSIQQGGRRQYFTESGKTLCSVGSVGTGNPALDTTTECWDVDSGRKIAQFDGFPGGAPSAASSHGSRLVLTHDRAFPTRTEGLVFPRSERVVWDFPAPKLRPGKYRKSPGRTRRTFLTMSPSPLRDAM